VEISVKDITITVVTVSYNAKEVIEQTILSVIEQTYPRIEYIIIDGGSTDGTVEIIKKYESKIAYWASEPDKGIYDAMNKGLDKATGDWINFMNAGDCFYDKFTVEKAVNRFHLLSPAVVYGDFVSKTSIGLFPQKLTPFFLSNKYIYGKDICHQSVFVKTILAKAIRFDLNYPISADFKMLYEIYKLNYPFFYISEPVAIFEVENGISINNAMRAYKENAMILGKYKTFRYRLDYSSFASRKMAKNISSSIVKHLCSTLFRAIKRKRLNAHS
jgi:glycosyltransferase involved in cell wall biosynthesis